MTALPINLNPLRHFTLSELKSKGGKTFGFALDDEGNRHFVPPSIAATFTEDDIGAGFRAPFRRLSQDEVEFGRENDELRRNPATELLVATPIVRDADGIHPAWAPLAPEVAQAIVAHMATIETAMDEIYRLCGITVDEG